MNVPEPTRRDIEQVERLVGLARQALAAGEEDAAIPQVHAGAERFDSPLLWRWTGLLQRSLDDHEDALDSLATAARLGPNKPGVAIDRAWVNLEAGLPAADLFEHALSLAPRNGSALIGRASARAAEGQAERAAEELSELLEQQPMWTGGHEYLAQLMTTLGRPNEATRSVEQALKQSPDSNELWESLFNIQLRRGAYDALAEAVARAARQRIGSPELPIYQAICAAEFDEQVFPPELFEAAPADLGAILDSWRIRHLLRVGAPEAALPIIDRHVFGSNAADSWAYAATAWRMTEDPRWEWLEHRSDLVQVIDLKDALPPADVLANTLRGLHVAKGEYLDQSVRGGTQTDGHLFQRIDPVIRRLRTAVVEAVESYVRGLPAPDPRHPLLRERRDRPVRFSGSWSVRLRSGGHHANHVHPQGWISSALYIALPERSSGEPENAGSLTLGEPDDRLGLGLAAWREIEPAVGRLVLFPSWMWHGTRPFVEGERMTVAFDVRRPI